MPFHTGKYPPILTWRITDSSPAIMGSRNGSGLRPWTEDETETDTNGGAGLMQAIGLLRYPIKSCRGQAISTAEFDARGIAHDREFVIIDANGTFLTQRQIPWMALIAPEFVDGGLRVPAPAGDVDFWPVRAWLCRAARSKGVGSGDRGDA